MNDFLNYLLHELRGALMLAVFAVVLVAAGIAVTYVVFRYWYRGERKFPAKKAFLAVVLVGYLAVLLYATILRGQTYGAWNLHLFRAWREAWNSFSFKNWANVLLNVALFVPLGLFLPPLIPVFRRWYWMLLAGFGTTFAIECIQLFTCRGMFDVDDLFANTVGAVFGYGVAMAILVSRESKPKRMLVYAALPVVIFGSISSIFIAYYVKPYGNLEDAPTYRISTGGITWVLSADLSDEETTVSIYRAQTYNKETCDAFGAAFFENLGAAANDIVYYDQETWFMDHIAHTLSVSHRDRSYTYRSAIYYYRDNGAVPTDFADRETVETLLAGYGITIPEEASFDGTGDGWYFFSLPRTEGGTVGGTLTCRLIGGAIANIENRLVSYEFCAEENILTETEAYEKLRRGDFAFSGMTCAFTRAEVTDCTLTYLVDTKGYYQPVYFFTISDENNETQAMIPAIK